jgi:hypothetical protein
MNGLQLKNPFYLLQFSEFFITFIPSNNKMFNYENIK